MRGLAGLGGAWSIYTARQVDIIMVSNNSEKLMLSMVSRLRRLLRNALRTTKPPNVIASSDMPQPIHDVHLRGVIGRNQRTDQSHQSRDEQSCCPHAGRH